MIKTIFTLACATTLTGYLAGCATASREVPLKESQVPAAVLTAFRNQFPEAHVTRYALEKKGSHDFYEMETDGKDAPHSLIYTPTGELAETEMAIPFTQLPAAVQEASKRASPTGKVELVEIAQKKGKTFYEIHFKENGHILETMFDPAGRLVEKKYE